MVGGRTQALERRELVWLNIFIVYFAVPALIFRLVARAPVQELGNWTFIVATTVATYLVFMLMFVVAVVVDRCGTRTATLQGVSASYGNIGYMGVPLAVVLFGEAGAVPATLIVCFDSALVFALVPLLVSMSGSRESVGAALVRAGRDIAANPLIVALVLGAVSAGVGIEFSGPVGRAVDSTLGHLGAAAAPVALFGIGITMARQYGLHAQMHSEVLVISVLKLVVHPLVVLMLLALFGGFDPVWVSVAVLLAALPTAANVYVMASHYDIYVEGASNALLVTTTLALFTLPVVLWLMAEGHVSIGLFQP